MAGWAEYVAAWVCFLGAHVIPASPRIKERLVALLGRRGYLALFSVTSILLLLWLIGAAGRAPWMELWNTGVAGRWLINLAMPAAILTGVLARGLSGLVAAFAIWAGAHLVVNGDLAHTILFGGMLVFALSGLARSGLPRDFGITPLRLLAAVLIWVALLHLHSPVIGVSPLPF